jgi:threonine synthase
MFNDFAFRDRVRLAGVNSINWARVLAQVVYYFTAAVSLGAPHRAVSFTVPTGNFGDIFAGYIARPWACRSSKLVVATNQNDILHRCAELGPTRAGWRDPLDQPVDGYPGQSNFERALFDAYGRRRGVAQLMDELKAGGFTVSQGALQAARKLRLGPRLGGGDRATIARGAVGDGRASVPAQRRGREGRRGASPGARR